MRKMMLAGVLALAPLALGACAPAVQPTGSTAAGNYTGTNHYKATAPQIIAAIADIAPTIKTQKYTVESISADRIVLRNSELALNYNVVFTVLENEGQVVVTHNYGGMDVRPGSIVDTEVRDMYRLLAERFQPAK